MPPEGVRRSSRIPREVAILLVGSDMEGKMFSEQTKTVLLSRHGAGIVSQYALYAEQELILRRLDTNKEAEIRVVGNLGKQGNTYTYGVAFLKLDTDLWDIKFPGMTDSENAVTRVLLQCSSCKTCETVEQIDLESDVYLVNEGIVRSCKKCGTSTFWKRAMDDAVEELVPVAASATRKAEIEENEEAVARTPVTDPETPVAAKSPAKAENRRKHLRTKVSFKACIRSYAFGDDVVTCEDMSRAGLRFKSRKAYTVNAEIEVAAPYSPGSQAIFVRGHIAHVTELKEERRYRCGVCYSKS